MRTLSRIFLVTSLVYASFTILFITGVFHSVAKAATNHIVISQIQLSGEGNAQDEFVELYNPTNVAIEMTEWRLTRKS